LWPEPVFPLWKVPIGDSDQLLCHSLNTLGERIFSSAEGFQCGEQSVFVGGYGVGSEFFFNVTSFFITARSAFE
jgi:hypothetical protein